MNYLISGVSPTRLGNAHPNIAPYEVVPTLDGYLILAVGNDGQFRKFCGFAGLDSLPDDERYATNSARVKNRAELSPLVHAATARWTKAELLAACEANGVPAGAINTIAEMFDDPQIKARGLRIDLEDRDGNSIPSVRTPIVFSGTPLAYQRPSPRLDEHGAEVLAELEALEAGKSA